MKRREGVLLAGGLPAMTSLMLVAAGLGASSPKL